MKWCQTKNNPTKKNCKLRQIKNTRLPNDTLPSNQEETLSQEQKINLENVKRIMSSEKTILQSLRNIEWKTLKIETNKIIHILPYIPTNNITELNELIYAGAKLVCEKIEIPQKSHEETVKTGMGNSIENAPPPAKKTTETKPELIIIIIIIISKRE